MIQILASLIGIVTVLLVPVAGVVLLLCDRKLRQRTSAAGYRRILRILMLSGSLLVTLGVLGIIGTLAVVVADTWASEIDLADVVACGIAVMLSLVVLAGGRVALQSARPLGKETAGGDELGNADRSSPMLRAVGWLLTLLPLVYFGPGLFLGFGVPLCVAAVVLSVLAVRRRSEEAHLLWVMAIAVENRMPLADELDVHAQTLRRRRQIRVQQLVARLRSGIPLSEALREFPSLIPRFAVLAVEVAEPLGTTAKALRDAAVRHTASIRKSSTSSSVVWFVVYYSLAVIVAFNLFGFLAYYIAPKFHVIFRDMGVELPPLTLRAYGIFESVQENALLLAPLAAVPVLVLFVLGVGYYRGWGNLKLPLIGKYLTRIDTPWILRNLAETVSNGQPLQAGLAPMARYHHRPETSQRLRGVAQRVEGGGDCWQSLQAARFILPPEETLLAAAARAGNLPWALKELADEIERRQRLRVLAAFEFIRPVLVLAIGLAVAGYCIAWFLPIVHLINDQSVPY